MEIGNGFIRQLVKKEEYANAGIDLTLNSKINIWSNDLVKVDNIFALILNMLKEQILIQEGIEEHSLLRPRDFDKSKVVLFAKNKEYFENLNLPKELLFAEKILSNGDEKLLNYLLENIIENTKTAYDKTFSAFDKYENDNEIDEELKDKLALFYNDYNAHYKKPYVFVMIEDISSLKDDRTMELLKKVFEIGRSKYVISCFGSKLEENVEFLSQFANANITLVDKMNENDKQAWYSINNFGLGNIEKLDKLNEEDYLCIKGNLYDQGRNYGNQPFILTIRDYKKEIKKKADENNNKMQTDIDKSLLNTFPVELAEYRYSLQDEIIKYMSNFSDLKRVVIKDAKTLIMDYMEFDTVENYDVLTFMNDNVNKIRNEFNYRIGEYLKGERIRGRHLRIERCFSFGRNMEISEYIKLRQDDNKIQYDWQINAVILAKCIKDLWNIQNEKNRIENFHFYKYPKEYRKRYGYNDEWNSEDLI